MPSGGDGVYYLSTYLLVDIGEGGRFDMRLNDDIICSTFPDHFDSVMTQLQDHAALLWMLSLVKHF